MFRLQESIFAGLSCSGIDVWRGESQVLAGVGFELRAGQCIQVVGPNGSGKTTLLRVVTGLLAPERGSIEWGGRAIRGRQDEWCASFSYLAHSDGLKSELTARENLEFEVRLRRRVADSEFGKALEQVGLAAAGDLAAGALSAGQRRRLALGRVLLTAAPLWVLDEPYTHLDAAGMAFVSGVIGRHLDAGGAALIAAHQPPAIPNHQPHRLELG